MTVGVSNSEQYRFIDTMIYACAEVASTNNLPLAAMIACAVVESAYGTSSIYWKTGCPFNLQRPSWYTWVHCQTVSIKTCVKTDASGKCIGWATAPFCYAEGNDEETWLADAGRLWCEWVLGWPQPATRKAVLAMRDKPADFARSLPRLGFGEATKRIQNGQRFEAALRQHALVERCWYA